MSKRGLNGDPLDFIGAKQYNKQLQQMVTGDQERLHAVLRSSGLCRPCKFQRLHAKCVAPLMQFADGLVVDRLSIPSNSASFKPPSKAAVVGVGQRLNFLGWMIYVPAHLFNPHPVTFCCYK